MSVHVILSTTLRDVVPGYQPTKGILLELPEPTEADAIARQLGIPIEEIKIVMINGRRSELSTVIRDGDRVSYFPAVGGG